MDRQAKTYLELKKSQRNVKQNIERLYSISSALYQEIQDIKNFVNYKHNDDISDAENRIGKINLQDQQPNKNRTPLQSSMSVLDNLEEYTESIPQNRKMKIINN
jgi:hypothetical protein